MIETLNHLTFIIPAITRSGLTMLLVAGFSFFLGSEFSWPRKFPVCIVGVVFSLLLLYRFGLWFFHEPTPYFLTDGSPTKNQLWLYAVWSFWGGAIGAFFGWIAAEWLKSQR